MNKSQQLTELCEARSQKAYVKIQFAGAYADGTETRVIGPFESRDLAKAYTKYAKNAKSKYFNSFTTPSVSVVTKVPSNGKSKYFDVVEPNQDTVMLLQQEAAQISNDRQAKIDTRLGNTDRSVNELVSVLLTKGKTFTSAKASNAMITGPWYEDRDKARNILKTYKDVVACSPTQFKSVFNTDPKSMKVGDQFQMKDNTQLIFLGGVGSPKDINKVTKVYFGLV